jgi:hypothetical protein
VCQGGWLSLKDRQRMNHTIHVANAYLHTKGGRTINLTSNGTCGNSQDNLLNKRNLKWVAALVDFIINPRMLKHKTRVILTLEMAQAFNTSKSQTIYFFNVSHFHLAPNMSIISSVHALHLLGSPIGLWTWGNSNIKLDKEKIHCLNFHCVIVQRAQFIGGMQG